MLIIGIDTGGTFTDFVYKDGNCWNVLKILSTPLNPADAVLRGVKLIADKSKVQIVHGTTIATNTILEKDGAKTALLSNKGFEDILEIGRQDRRELYNFCYKKNPALVSKDLRFGIDCRINSSGDILKEIEKKEIFDVAYKLEKEGVEAVAVSLLFSFLNPDHEKKIGKILGDQKFAVSLSHEVLSEYKEFERTSTTVINAYVLPRMSKYITHIEKFAGESNVRIMQSNGGSISAKTAKREPVRTILSGPAGGVVGAYEIGKISGENKLITFDMGGTSTDVALVDQVLPFKMESEISKYPVKVPMVDIHTVGAGGGSVARIDIGGVLKVGPKSAGAYPGPVCYGTGDKITVTDANLYLGRIVPDFFLGGTMKLDLFRLNKYLDTASKKAGLSKVAFAEGVILVVNAEMEKAIRVISIERGFDPKEFTLFSYGGAGGLHAAFLARALNIPKVLIPKNPGIHSATGMLMADIVKDFSKTVMLKQNNVDVKTCQKLFLPLEKRSYNELENEGAATCHIDVKKYLDMRYVGQSYEILVPFDADFIETFHNLHKKRYGYCNKNLKVEIVNIRIRAIGFNKKPVFKKNKLKNSKPLCDAQIGERDVIFESSSLKTPVFARQKLECGNIIKGPLVLTEYSSTIVVPPFAACMVDEYENIVIIN